MLHLPDGKKRDKLAESCVVYAQRRTPRLLYLLRLRVERLNRYAPIVYETTRTKSIKSSASSNNRRSFNNRHLSTIFTFLHRVTEVCRWRGMDSSAAAQHESVDSRRRRRDISVCHWHLSTSSNATDHRAMSAVSAQQEHQRTRTVEKQYASTNATYRNFTCMQMSRRERFAFFRSRSRESRHRRPIVPISEDSAPGIRLDDLHYWHGTASSVTKPRLARRHTQKYIYESTSTKYICEEKQEDTPGTQGQGEMSAASRALASPPVNRNRRSITSDA